MLGGWRLPQSPPRGGPSRRKSTLFGAIFSITEHHTHIVQYGKMEVIQLQLQLFMNCKIEFRALSQYTTVLFSTWNIVGEGQMGIVPLFWFNFCFVSFLLLLLFSTKIYKNLVDLGRIHFYQNAQTRQFIFPTGPHPLDACAFSVNCGLASDN